MRWHKRLLKKPAIQAALARLIAAYIRLARATCRWQTRGAAFPLAHTEAGRPFLVVLWHQRLALMPGAWHAVAKGRTCRLLISSHRDGELLTRTYAHLGIGTIRGSSSRGGAQAFRAILEHLGGGETVAITPDGPRGPRMHLAAGVVRAARESGVPILPLALATAPRAEMRSWDRFLVPRPFSRGVAIWGEPVSVPAGLDAAGIEAQRQALEATLTALTQEADRAVGATPTEPAAPARGPS